MINIQERIDLPSRTIFMAPEELLQVLFKMFNELETFLTFTRKYVVTNEFNLNPRPDIIPELINQNKSEVEVKGTVDIYSSRKCVVCQDLFKSPLWDFIQKLARKLSLRIKLNDIYFKKDEAFCRAIYEIERIPTIKYKERTYQINPAKEEGMDPHLTVKRELLDFFDVLGLYNPSDILDGGSSATHKKKEEVRVQNGDRY